MRRFRLIHQALLLSLSAAFVRTCARLEQPDGRQHHQQHAPWSDGGDNDEDVAKERTFDASSHLHTSLDASSPNMTDPNGTAFCDNSMTMSMFMDGFHSSLLSVTWGCSCCSSSSPQQPTTDDVSGPFFESSKPPAPPSCLSYLSPSFELSSPGRFGLAMLASFVMAVLLEALTVLKCNVQCRGVLFVRRRKGKAPAGQQRQEGGDDSESEPPPRFSPRQRLAIMTVIHGLQGLLGLVIMLVTMAYSVELLASVVAGLMAGHAALAPMASVLDGIDRRRSSIISIAPFASERRQVHARGCLHEIRPEAAATGRDPPESSLSSLLQPLLPPASSSHNDQSYVV